MKKNSAAPIKAWIKNMGMKLTKSHLLNRKQRTIKYYTLDNFGVYEEIVRIDSPERRETNDSRFISWTPTGDAIEVRSVKDVSMAYHDYVSAAQ